VVEISQSLADLVKEAFRFPLRLGASGTMVIGLMVMMILTVASFAPLIGIPVVLGGLAYIAAYYFDVISATLNGQHDAPPWPELSSVWDDVVVPGFQMLVIALLSSALQIAAMFLVGEDSDYFSHPLFWAGIVFKWLYFPMASLAVVCTGSIWPALPHQVLPAVVRCLPGYLVCAAVIALTDAVHAAFSAGLEHVPVIGWIVPALIAMYGLLVEARLAGLVYLRYHKKLPW
jgi:hypothetical protein